MTGDLVMISIHQLPPMSIPLSPLICSIHLWNDQDSTNLSAIHWSPHTVFHSCAPSHALTQCSIVIVDSVLAVRRVHPCYCVNVVKGAIANPDKSIISLLPPDSFHVPC